MNMLLFVFDVGMPRECEGDGNAGSRGRCGCDACGA